MIFWTNSKIVGDIMSDDDSPSNDRNHDVAHIRESRTYERRDNYSERTSERKTKKRVMTVGARIRRQKREHGEVAQ